METEITYPMKCKTLRKKILSYADGELSAYQNATIQNHLNDCADCRKQVDRLSHLFDGADEVNRIAPSPFLWTRLSVRIDAYESHRNYFSTIRERMLKYAMSIGVLLIFSIGIGTGIFLGSFPESQISDIVEREIIQPADEQFIQSSYINTFENLPPKSLGAIYMALSPENKERKK